MEQHIEPRVLLLAAEYIRQHGQRQDDKYCYQQTWLEISHDGYTVTLNNSAVTIRLYFHNKVKADYRRMHELEDFYATLCKLINA